MEKRSVRIFLLVILLLCYKVNFKESFRYKLIVFSLIYRILLFGTDYGSTFENIVQEVNFYLTTYGSTLNFVAAFYITYINTRYFLFGVIDKMLMHM